MWPLRVGPINTLNGMRDTETSSSGDTGKSKRLFDNTLVMSFVEHTIILTLTGEEVSISGFFPLKTMNPPPLKCANTSVLSNLNHSYGIFRSRRQKFLGLPRINKLFTLVTYNMVKLYRSLLYPSDLSMQNQNNLLSKLIIVFNAKIN